MNNFNQEKDVRKLQDWDKFEFLPWMPVWTDNPDGGLDADPPRVPTTVSTVTNGVTGMPMEQWDGENWEDLVDPVLDVESPASWGYLFTLIQEQGYDFYVKPDEKDKARVVVTAVKDRYVVKSRHVNMGVAALNVLLRVVKRETK